MSDLATNAHGLLPFQ